VNARRGVAVEKRRGFERRGKRIGFSLSRRIVLRHQLWRRSGNDVGVGKGMREGVHDGGGDRLSALGKEGEVRAGKGYIACLAKAYCRMERSGPRKRGRGCTSASRGENLGRRSRGIGMETKDLGCKRRGKIVWGGGGEWEVYNSYPGKKKKQKLWQSEKKKNFWDIEFICKQRGKKGGKSKELWGQNRIFRGVARVKRGKIYGGRHREKYATSAGGEGGRGHRGMKGFPRSSD